MTSLQHLVSSFKSLRSKEKSAILICFSQLSRSALVAIAYLETQSNLEMFCLTQEKKVLPGCSMRRMSKFLVSQSIMFQFRQSSTIKHDFSKKLKIHCLAFGRMNTMLKCRQFSTSFKSTAIKHKD